MNDSAHFRDIFEDEEAGQIRELDDWVRQELARAAGCEYVAGHEDSFGAVRISAKLRA